MNSVKSFLRALDIFGVNFSFRYKSKEKYQTSLGGFFVILFFILVVGMGIYYFIPFINRKNYTIVYYAMNLAETEEVNLFESNSNFAVGLNCEKNDEEKEQIYNLLDLKSRYVLYIKDRTGAINKDATNLVNHKCNYDDFYNKYDKQMDYMGVQNFDCIADKTASIQGIYADRVFSYFEFSVVAKNKSADLMNEIERFLFQNDCKLQFVYTDIIIDLDNYKEPITQYINEIFIQLNPTLFIKRNIYFMNQYFTNDDYLMFVFGDDEPPETKPLYSRYEEYALYKGLNRAVTQPEEYDYFTKIYIRADLKRTVINRKYQKFMEFYADASSLLIAIYEILVIIFNFIDTFYAQHSLARIIFFFKELKEENSFNFFKKNKKIQELLYVADSSNSKRNSIEIESKGEQMNKYFLPLNKDSERMRVLDKEENQKEIKIYNTKKKTVESKQTKNSTLYKINNDIEEKKDFDKLKNSKMIKTSKNANTNKLGSNNLENDDFQKYKNSQLVSSKNSEAILNFRYNNKDNFDLSESVGTNMEESSSESGTGSGRKKNIRVENSFNVFEIIIVEFLKCFKSQNMQIKSEANERANNIIFKKLDIITYVRNMILFDIINQTLIDSNQKILINFLCRPIISIDKPNKSEFSEFYKNYKEKDFKKFYEEIQELSQKTNKQSMDNKLLSLSADHLKALV